MPNTYYPTQIGSTLTGNALQGVTISSVTIGRTITGSNEGAGFGANGRPDYNQVVVMNFTDRAGDGTLTQKGTITLNVGDIIAAKNNNANVPVNLNLILREVAVCDDGNNKRMIILGSQTYNP